MGCGDACSLVGVEFTPEMMEGRYRLLETGEIELVLNGMVPPEPALCILHLLEAENPETLIAKLDRNPINLYDVLEEKGWHVVDGGVIDTGFHVVIRRKA